MVIRPSQRLPSRQNRRLGRAVALAVASLLIVCVSRRARAAQDGIQLSLDWQRLGEMVHGRAAFSADSSWGLASGSQERRGAALGISGVTPDASLVARDWSGARLVLGHLSPTDQFRLSHSTRMVLGRVRFPMGPVAPFAQFGLGQWRVDTDLFPACRRDVELAGQVASGIQVELSRFIAIVAESDLTILYREQREPQTVAQPQIWAASLAARGVF